VTNTALTSEDLKAIIKQSKSHGDPVALYTQETAPIDLFHKQNKNESKIDSLKKIVEKQIFTMNEVFLEASLQLIECTFSLNPEVKLYPGAELLEKADTSHDLAFSWQTEDESLSGLYLFDKSLFFKIFDMMFGGRRVFIKQANLTDLEVHKLEGLLLPLHAHLNHTLTQIDIPEIKLGVLLADLQKPSKSYSNNEILEFNIEIKAAEEALGSFKILFTNDILRFFSEKLPEEVGNNQEKDQSLRHSIKKCVEDIPVKIKVELGHTKASLRDILNVKIGDQWPLIVEETGHLVEVEGVPFSLASIGEAAGMRAVQIKELFKGE
jgi:flagellar motor switch protein FliM